MYNYAYKLLPKENTLKTLRKWSIMVLQIPNIKTPDYEIEINMYDILNHTLNIF